jgi:hypothetical protein
MDESTEPSERPRARWCRGAHTREEPEKTSHHQTLTIK